MTSSIDFGEKRRKYLIQVPDDLWGLILQFSTDSLHTWALAQHVNRQFKRCALRSRALSHLGLFLPQAHRLERLGSTLPGINTLVLGAINGSLPCMSKLTALQRLSLSSYAENDSRWVERLDITNKHLATLTSLMTLQSLRLDGCVHVSDLSPLSCMTTLSKLSLRHCSVTDLTPLTYLPLAKLMLDDNELITDFSPLANMFTLRSISLENCKLLPDRALESLSGLKQLHAINLSYCLALSSDGLCSLAELTGLKELDFTGTKLTDDALRVLCQSLDLEELLLYDCQITNLALPHLANQQSLRCLKLDGCVELTDLQPLAQLKALRKLGLSDCFGLSDQRIEPLSKLVDLEELDLENSNVSEAAFTTVRALVSLKVLSVGPISDVGLQAIGPLTSLQQLNLGYAVSDRGMQALARLTGLQTVDLSQGQKVTDEGLRALDSLTSLHTVNLSGLPITNASLKTLAKIVSLTSVDLSQCKHITAVGVRTMETLVKMQTLNLAGCVRVYLVEGLPRFALPHFPKLCTLDLRQVRIQWLDRRLFTNSLQKLNVSLSAAAFLDDMSSLPCEPALNYLNMSRCRSSELSSLRQLRHFPKLRELNLSRNAEVGDEHVRILACLPVSTLNVCGCEAITDLGVCALATSSTLTNLNVSDCDLITDIGLQALSLSAVKKLICSACDRVTAAGIAKFSKHGEVRAHGCLMAGEAAQQLTLWPKMQASPLQDTDHALEPTRSNKALHLSLLAFAFRITAEEWFFVDSVDPDRIALHVDRNRVEESAMFVDVSFDEVDWEFISNQFSTALPNVHRRWYFFQERRRKRVWVHARPLLK